MPEEPSEPPTALPASQPPLADAVPTADSNFVIPFPFEKQCRSFTVPAASVRYLASTDKCFLKIMRELAEAKAREVPQRGLIEAQKKKIQAEVQQLNQLQALGRQKKAEVDYLIAKAKNRLLAIQERQEAKQVRAIRRRIDPKFL